jgi:hypothetical protein
MNNRRSTHDAAHAGDQPLPGVEGAVVRWVARLPDVLADSVRVGAFSVARPGALLRIIPGVARFLARDGAILEVAPDKGVERSVIMPLVHGPLAAALIHQRGEVPLHGATVVHPHTGVAYSIVGPQGAGKSTLAYELVRRGWTLVSDDLTRLTTKSGEVMAWPGRTGIKLCGDACDRFALSRASLAPIGERGKLLADVMTDQRPRRLRAVLALERGRPDFLLQVKGIAALSLLSSNCMKLTYVNALGVARAHASQVACIAATIPVIRLCGAGPPSLFGDRIERLDLPRRRQVIAVQMHA